MTNYYSNINNAYNINNILPVSHSQYVSNNNSFNSFIQITQKYPQSQLLFQKKNNQAEIFNYDNQVPSFYLNSPNYKQNINRQINFYSPTSIDRSFISFVSNNLKEKQQVTQSVQKQHIQEDQQDLESQDSKDYFYDNYLSLPQIGIYKRFNMKKRKQKSQAQQQKQYTDQNTIFMVENLQQLAKYEKLIEQSKINFQQSIGQTDTLFDIIQQGKQKQSISLYEFMNLAHNFNINMTQVQVENIFMRILNNKYQQIKYFIKKMFIYIIKNQILKKN
ncbi:hypothetical protein IMG5_107790 [Ichthyophthirius multifiliis]|uniref:Uncharacterized protein n=1 Tax=Ichthyophthirius multifiliis TaxID=5932 RepID=G0QTC4_ICHMU|nr:hypothetical protein IMG5_107790 [Ichthyophthirius multifiliis]EGR31559.1 hypothetical protein IMG5_107790 [Ichthyophthirius multifiliis]|eukprot:XP_004035045.1 hypothetical protein IMG5_107790 [Ichthyophthirius multifiliis]